MKYKLERITDDNIIINDLENNSTFIQDLIGFEAFLFGLNLSRRKVEIVMDRLYEWWPTIIIDGIAFSERPSEKPINLFAFEESSSLGDGFNDIVEEKFGELMKQRELENNTT